MSGIERSLLKHEESLLISGNVFEVARAVAKASEEFGTFEDILFTHMAPVMGEARSCRVLFAFAHPDAVPLPHPTSVRDITADMFMKLMHEARFPEPRPVYSTPGWEVARAMIATSMGEDLPVTVIYPAWIKQGSLPLGDEPMAGVTIAGFDPMAVVQVPVATKTDAAFDAWARTAGVEHMPVSD